MTQLHSSRTETFVGIMKSYQKKLKREVVRTFSTM
jgi:hypothetical protein